jgi:ketosteroid isomerase-like protein
MRIEAHHCRKCFAVCKNTPVAQNQVEIAQHYFDAWNQHDAAAIIAMFVDGGTYLDPATPATNRIRVLMFPP